MSINQPSVLSQIQQAINEYGYEVQILRNIYEVDEIDCKKLVEAKKPIGKIKCIVDNYGPSGYKKSIINTDKGIIKNETEGTLYAPYTPESLVQKDDFIRYDGVEYIVKQVTDVMHYHLLYNIELKRADV